jgi:hypothetical protein
MATLFIPTTSPRLASTAQWKPLQSGERLRVGPQFESQHKYGVFFFGIILSQKGWQIAMDGWASEGDKDEDGDAVGCRDNPASAINTAAEALAAGRAPLSTTHRQNVSRNKFCGYFLLFILFSGTMPAYQSTAGRLTGTRTRMADVVGSGNKPWSYVIAAAEALAGGRATSSTNPRNLQMKYVCYFISFVLGSQSNRTSPKHGWGMRRRMIMLSRSATNPCLTSTPQRKPLRTGRRRRVGPQFESQR